jgi:hypothetical protein
MNNDIQGLLIEWDPVTGKRAGNINPKKDRNLRCNGWQNMDVVPALELRLVEDDRDISYEGIEGITVLNGRAEINKAIDENFPSKIVIEDELLYSEHVKEKIREKQIKIDKLPDNQNERLIELKNKYGVKGIREIKPHKV